MAFDVLKYRVRGIQKIIVHPSDQRYLFTVLKEAFDMGVPIYNSYEETIKGRFIVVLKSGTCVFFQTDAVKKQGQIRTEVGSKTSKDNGGLLWDHLTSVA
jgi:hypothetical protein